MPFSGVPSESQLGFVRVLAWLNPNFQVRLDQLVDEDLTIVKLLHLHVKGDRLAEANHHFGLVRDRPNLGLWRYAKQVHEMNTMIMLFIFNEAAKLVLLPTRYFHVAHNYGFASILVLHQKLYAEVSVKGILFAISGVQSQR